MTHKTVIEGWLLKGSFNLAKEDHSDTIKGQLSSRLKPWNKRWFVLSDDGRGQAKLYYYKSQDDSRQTAQKVPIDMNTLTAVNAVNGPLEFEMRVGARLLRLKAQETAERERWMGALLAYISTHEAERQAARELNAKRYEQVGTGHRDLDQKQSTNSRTSMEGWLYRQDGDMLRRWRKWWCVVGGDELRCTLYESLKVTDGLRELSGGIGGIGGGGGGGGGGGTGTRAARGAANSPTPSLLPQTPPSGASPPLVGGSGGGGGGSGAAAAAQP